MNVITVSQVNIYIKAIFDENLPLKNIYISGEVSNFTHYYRTGHMYFTLKDDKSQLKAVMFSSNASRLKFMPENGMKVICRGRVSVYEKNGEYQMYVDDMQPDGLGALNLAFEQLKEKLFKEGVCDDEFKKKLPLYPRKIGVATSNIGAAVEDIKNITNRRFPLAELVISPTVVQGEYASADIVKSIRILDNIPDVDVIIVGRGGGSAEDLWAFNTEEVARAVVACNTPIVSAVGHETDFTICDFVADLRAPTPSAAAELVCPDICTLINYSNSLDEALYNYINDIVDNEMQKVNELSENEVLSDFNSVLELFSDNLNDLSKRTMEAFEYLLEKKQNSFFAFAGKLDALSPLSVIARGYCVAEKNEKIIKNINCVEVDDKISLLLNGGSAICNVIEVNKNE